MDELRRLNNRISGLRHRAKNEGDPEKRAVLESRLAEVTAERDAIKPPAPKRAASPVRPRPTPINPTAMVGAAARARGVAEGAPSIEQLEKSAAKFGGDGILETAVEAGYDFETCCRLLKVVDAADRGWRSAHKVRGKPPVYGHIEARVRKAMGITEEDDDAGA